MYEDINLKGDKKTILFEICQKIKVCYILLEILKYTKKLKSVTYKSKFQCVCHVDRDWGSRGPLEKICTRNMTVERR
jgi:hypothetical protein